MAVSSPKRKNVWSLAGGLSAALILGLLLGAGNAANNQAPPVEVQVSPHHVLHKVPNNAIGINASTYDRDLLYSRLPRLLRNIGIRLIRFPGGTESDRYNWATNTDVITNQKEAVDFNQFMKLVRKTHAQPMITVNYGTGSVIGTKTHQSGAQIAADWVYYANVLHHYNVKYWEIGNEVYGNGTYGANWEPDAHCQISSGGSPVSLGNEPQSTYGCGPETYANNVKRYIAAMKKVDPRISVGVVLTAAGAPNNWPNGLTNSQSPQSWNQMVLQDLGSEIGFADIHWYPQNPSNVSPPGPGDQILLASTAQIPNAVKTMQTELRDWAHNSHIPIMVTETNSVSSNPGKQTLSVVNALFLNQDYLGWLENGVSNVDWWQIHNGIGTTGDNGNANSLGQPISGDTEYGDYGVLSNGSCGITPSGSTVCEPPAETPFSSYYGLMMLSLFIHPGDVFLSASSSQSLVQAYAVRTETGNIRLLLINDSPSTAYHVDVSIPGYLPFGQALLQYGPNPAGLTRSYGPEARAKESTLAPYSMISYTLRAGHFQPRGQG